MNLDFVCSLNTQNYKWSLKSNMHVSAITITLSASEHNKMSKQIQ